MLVWYVEGIFQQHSLHWHLKRPVARADRDILPSHHRVTQSETTARSPSLISLSPSPSQDQITINHSVVD